MPHSNRLDDEEVVYGVCGACVSLPNSGPTDDELLAAGFEEVPRIQEFKSQCGGWLTLPGEALIMTRFKKEHERVDALHPNADTPKQDRAEARKRHDKALVALQKKIAKHWKTLPATSRFAAQARALHNVHEQISNADGHLDLQDAIEIICGDVPLM